MPGLEGLIDTARGNPKFMLVCCMAMLVIIVILLLSTSILGAKVDRFGSGGAMVRLQTGDSVYFPDGKGHGREGYMSLRRDKFAPGPETSDGNGASFVIDENGKKWWVLVTVNAAGVASKTYSPYRPGATEAERRRDELLQYGVDPAMCEVSGVGDDAWGWLSGLAKKGPVDAAEDYASGPSDPELMMRLKGKAN